MKAIIKFKPFQNDLLVRVTLFFVFSLLISILVIGLSLESARSEKYRNAAGEIVEMPKGMKAPPKQGWKSTVKAPPKQTWNSTPVQLPTRQGTKSTPTATVKKQPTPVTKHATSPKTGIKTSLPVKKPLPAPVTKGPTASVRKQPQPVKKLPARPPTTVRRPPAATPASPSMAQGYTGQRQPLPIRMHPPSSQRPRAPAPHSGTFSRRPRAYPESPGIVQRSTGQHQPWSPGISPWFSQRPEPSYAQPRTFSEESSPVTVSPSVNEPTPTEAGSSSERETSSGGVLPPWKPAAAGAAAGGAAALGALLTMAASGVRPREAWDGMKELLTQNPDYGSKLEPIHTVSPEPLNTVSPEPLNTVSPEPVDSLWRPDGAPPSARVAEVVITPEGETPVSGVASGELEGKPEPPQSGATKPGPPDQEPGLTPEEAKELEERQKAYDELIAERRKDEYTSRDPNKTLMEEILDEMELENAGTITDTDRLKLDDWIDVNAPTEDDARKMHDLVNKMTYKTADVKMVGNYMDVQKALNCEIQGMRQPDLTYLERYSLRDEIMEKAKWQGTGRGYVQDAAGTLQNISEGTKLKDLGIPGGTRLGNMAPGLDQAGKISEGIGYYEGYRGAGDGKFWAGTKAAAQMGIKSLLFKNPVVGVADTVVKYGSIVATGQEYSASKAAEFYTNTFCDAAAGDKIQVHFNAETGNYEMGAGVDNKIISDVEQKATRSLIGSIDEQLEKNPHMPNDVRNDLVAKQQALRNSLFKQEKP